MEVAAGVEAQSHPEGAPDGLAPRHGAAGDRRPSLADAGDGCCEPQDGTSLNARLLEQLNEQFEKKLQLVESERLGEPFKLSVYAEWVTSLRTVNTELVLSLREMQDTCMERMQVMRAAYLKDLVRFGPDVHLKRLPIADETIPVEPGEEIVSLELSSNYPIVPSTDEMLVRELDSKSRTIDDLHKELDELRRVVTDNGSMLDQLRNMTHEREKQLDDKRKEIGILQQQIGSLNDQLLKSKLSTAASTDNRSLISEITDHHDKITQLKKKLKEQEDKLRQANTAIQFRDEVIAQQRQEIKLLNESLENASLFSEQYDDETDSDESFPSSLSGSFRHARTSFGGGKDKTNRRPTADKAKKPCLEQAPTGPPPIAMDSESFRSFLPKANSTAAHGTTQSFLSGTPKLLLDELETLQKGGEAESRCIQLLKRELDELYAQLHEYKLGRFETDKGLLRLRGACEELLQATGKQTGCGDGWREDCDASSGGSLRFEDIDELIEAMRDRGEVLCRRLLADHRPGCAIEQDEGIGSVSTSRLEHSEPFSHRGQQQAMAVIEQQLKRLLTGKEHSNNSASESLSSLSLGLDEGCTLQGLIDDLKKEIESKDLVLRDRHDEQGRLQQELAVRDRELSQCRARQESIDGERTSLQEKITSLEECVDDQGRTIAMLNVEKVKLVRQVDDLKETLQQYRDNLQQTSEEKVAIEDECKNQLVTISNLRVALEETKRNGSSSVGVLHELVENLQLEVILLSEQLNDAFKENLAKDNELEQYRDSNLQLRCQMAELSRELGDLKDISDAVDFRQELTDQKDRLFVLLKNDARQLQDQMNGIRSEIASRQQDLGHLNYFREKCAEMERLHELEMSQQRSKHSSELKQLRREIESLSNQLACSADTSKQHEETVESLATLQTTILKLDEHNRVLQKAILSYQESIVQLEQQLGGSQHQLETVRQELDELRARCEEQEGKISTLRADKDRISGELLMQRKMCKCGFNANGSGSRERAKTPLSHSLQKQLAQKSLELKRAQDELEQRNDEWKAREAEYVSHRVRTTEQTTELIEQVSELKGRLGNVEQSVHMKDELIERLQQNLRDVNRKLAGKQDQLSDVESKSVHLSDALERARQEALGCEKRCTEELSNMRRSSMDQRNQLQQYERQINRLRVELDGLREKCDQISNERDVLRAECQGQRERLATHEGKESALCEVVKSNQDELTIKASRVLELEEGYRKLSNAHQQLKSSHEDLSKQFRLGQQELDRLRESSRKLLEFKQQTLSTKELTRKTIAEWKEREAQYMQEIGRMKKRTELLEQDRSKLVSKLNAYHRDNMILTRHMQQSQYQPVQQIPSRQPSPHNDNRRSYNLTPLHQTFYTPEAFKLVRSSSDPNCNEPDELLQKVEYTCSQLQQIRRFWHQGLKEALPNDP